MIPAHRAFCWPHLSTDILTNTFNRMRIEVPKNSSRGSSREMPAKYGDRRRWRGWGRSDLRSIHSEFIRKHFISSIVPERNLATEKEIYPHHFFLYRNS